MVSRQSKKDHVRIQAEASLETFIQLVHPHRVLGSVHREMISWWNREEAKSHQITLLPRDHQKSALIAYRVAWAITRDPTLRVLYISSTSNLAVKQLSFIKDILTSDIYRMYWPEMINAEEGKRKKWTETEIAVDHPLRKAETVRDPTIFAGGLTTSVTGLHCDIAVLDDVVVYDNAYTEDGREKVEQLYSLLSSIESADALEWVVGTRYHPKDLYSKIIAMEVDQWNDDGEPIEGLPLYELFERQVENRGDGTGEFLWPRQQRYDGKMFGFDMKILARKRAQYIDQTQFRAQYYNDPNDYENASITRDCFQYYNKTFLSCDGGRWYYKQTRLNVFASVDFAYSLSKRADYTSIVVVGVDGNHNYYVLDIDRFKTDKISEYFNRILYLHQKWGFHKMRAEVTAAQKVIVDDIKQNYIRVHGLALSIEDYRPTREQGAKEERIEAILQPRYANRQVWHYQGGNCQSLEEELVLRHPPHDDIKDCLATAIDGVIIPTTYTTRSGFDNYNPSFSNSKFGGIS